MMKIWNEPDIYQINQPNSIEKYNAAYEIRSKQYTYDEDNLTDVKHIVEEIEDKGYIILKNVIDKDLLKKVREDSEKLWDEGVHVKPGPFSQLNKPDDAYQLAVKNPIYRCPSIIPLVFNDISLMVATEFFKCFPAIGTLNLRKSFVNNSIDSQGTQLWHVDRNSPRLMKTFMYLNDVDEDGGPFCVVEGSRKNMVNDTFGSPYFYRNPGRQSDEWVESAFGKDKIKKLTANMGDLIISNQTANYHKGLKPTKRERAMLTVNWVIHPEEFRTDNWFKIREEDYQNLPDYKKPLADFLVRT